VDNWRSARWARYLCLKARFFASVPLLVLKLLLNVVRYAFDLQKMLFDVCTVKNGSQTRTTHHVTLPCCTYHIRSQLTQVVWKYRPKCVSWPSCVYQVEVCSNLSSFLYSSTVSAYSSRRKNAMIEFVSGVLNFPFVQRAQACSTWN